jgi:uncharacterized protein
MQRFFNDALLPVLIGLVIIIAAGVFAYEKLYANKALLFKTEVPVLMIGKTPLRVAVADTEAEREKGLSWQKGLPDKSGMLFIFESSGYHGFWMKDMIFPIDIIWVDETFHIVDIEANVTPESYPKTFEPDVPARFAVETAALFTSANGIKVGGEVTFPPELIPADLKKR